MATTFSVFIPCFDMQIRVFGTWNQAINISGLGYDRGTRIVYKGSDMI